MKPGDFCPACAECNTKGKLYSPEPGVIISLHGNPIINGTKYKINKLRCTVCNIIFTPNVTEELQEKPKYDASCAVAIAIHKYSLGATFYRMDKFQSMLGIPVPKSTQWDLVDDLYDAINPVFSALEHLAAQSDDLKFDDSPHKILKLPMDSKRKSCVTTGIIAHHNKHPIKLLYTGVNLAGENVNNLLEQRIVDSDIITMSDASNNNFTMPANILVKLIICYCLVHGRRNFIKIFDFFQPECEFVIDCISKVYENDKYCRDNKLDDFARQRYHQAHSTQIMNNLRTWFVNKLKYKDVEPNSGLGQAIKYMLNNWVGLTRFLTVPGAAIDNNASERLMKTAILHRKNSLFYKTSRGAMVGGTLMSLIQTAIANNVNPFEYLVALSYNRVKVKENPEAWLPWCYLQQINNLPQEQAA